jgi:hypothetical protein
MVDVDYPAETWGFAVFGALAALVASALPVVAFVRVVPALKEALLGAAMVLLLLETTDPGDGAAFAVLAGTAATLLFNAFVLAAGLVGVPVLGGGAAAVAAVAPDLAPLFRAARLLSVLVVSPAGYALGGAVGAWLNGREAPG